MAEKFTIAVADPMEEEGLGPLVDDPRFEVVRAYGPEAAGSLEELLDGAEGLLVRSATKADAALLGKAPSLRVIGRAGVGVDNIDLLAATARGIAVLNAPTGNTVAAAELTMALMLAAARHVPAADRSLRSAEWARSRFQGIELRGRTLGLVGAGRIGSAVAARARSFGMKVIAFDPFLSPAAAAERGFELRPLEALVEEADVLTLHVPLNDATRSLLDRDMIRRMRRGAVLVNVARGGVVDEAAVAEALHDGHLAAAAFDVYGSEPLVEDSPLRAAPNIVLTPHLGASTAEAQLRVAREISEALCDALLKGDLTSAVNAPSVGGDQLIRMMPFMALGSRLGAIAAALAPKAPRAVEIRLHSDEGETGRRVLAGSVLTGFLGQIVGRGTVNLVNAFHLAEQRGLEVRITRVAGSTAPRMRVEVEGESGTVEVQGGLLAEREHPRLLAIDGHALSVIPEGTLVVIRNSDVPGVIGRVGTLLGEHRVNIAGYNQSRRAQGGEALAALTVDGPLPDNALSSLRALDGISEVRSVTFSD